jgi:hypothetical protein
MIPKKIYQTHKDYNLSSNLKSLIHNMISLNPEFEYTFMDNDECFKFIEENFDKDFIEMYKNLPLDIMRADVWRVAVIYINGGIYSDCDVVCEKPLSKLIENEDLVIFTEISGGISNFFFAAKPKHPSLRAVLDLMVKNQNITRDTNSNLMVQDFGMDLLHKVMIQTENKKQLTYEESREWVNHMCYGSWRNDERDYKNESNTTKQLTFFTTFHQSGYDLYGKSWINSFIKNVLSKRNNIFGVIYADNISDLEINHPQLKILDFNKEIPNHINWKEEYITQSTHSEYVKKMTVRFSHKGAVMQHTLNTIKEGYGICVDGDVIFENGDYSEFPKIFFENNEVIACQVEDNNHIESGILIFDLENPNLQRFTESYIKNYSLNEILHNYGEPYDGHVTRRSLDNSGVLYYDLNKNFGKGGIQSDPNETFLHPELNLRFTHNIGITGKKNYGTWNNVKEKDSIFSVLEQGGFKPLTKEQLHIKKLRSKR